jgi:hypothetical protein
MLSVYPKRDRHRLESALKKRSPPPGALHPMAQSPRVNVQCSKRLAPRELRNYEPRSRLSVEQLPDSCQPLTSRLS